MISPFEDQKTMHLTEAVTVPLTMKKQEQKNASKALGASESERAVFVTVPEHFPAHYTTTSTPSIHYQVYLFKFSRLGGCLFNVTWFLPLHLGPLPQASRPLVGEICIFIPCITKSSTVISRASDL